MKLQIHQNGKAMASLRAGSAGAQASMNTTKTTFAGKFINKNRAHMIGSALNMKKTVRAAKISSTIVAAAAPSGNDTILVAEKLGAPGIDMLKQAGEVDCSYGLSKEDLLEKIKGVDAIVIRSATKVDRSVFEAAKGRLRVVGRAGVGIDNVDLAAASEYGCLVVNAPTANTVAAAEHGIALLCSLARNVSQADASMKQGKWDRNTYVGVSMVGKTLAILGFGKVGSELARRAKGLGMNAVAYDPYASEERAAALGVKLVSLDEALATADFFSLHMPLTPTTKHLLNDEAFAKMKKGARIINVARGGVIDDHALCRALDAGIVAGAALDVFEPEPPVDNPLVGRPDVICTPHLGASTREAQEEVAVEIAEAVLGALRGELTSSVVNAPMVAPEVLKELAPFVDLASGLGRAAVQLVESQGFSDVYITYHSSRGDDLDTRLLRAMVLKGILEATTESTVNIVNADLLAKSRGLRIIETVVSSDSAEILERVDVALGSSASKFSSAKDENGRIAVAGTVKGELPFMTRIGTFDVDIALEGEVLLVRQTDQPGIIAGVSSLLAQNGINVSYMTVSRVGRSKEAIMAIGVDEQPSANLLADVAKVKGVQEPFGAYAKNTYGNAAQALNSSPLFGKSSANSSSHCHKFVTCAAAASSDAATALAPEDDFDWMLCLALGGCAFEAYLGLDNQSEDARNKPNTETDPLHQESSNGTRMYYTNPSFLREKFDGLLEITIVGAKGLSKSDLLPTFSSDPYCTVSVGGSYARTPTIMRNINPEWNHSTCLFVQDVKSQRLNVRVLDDDFGSSDDFLGAAMRGLADLEDGKENVIELPLTGGTGSVTLKLKYDAFSAEEGVLQQASSSRMVVVEPPKELLSSPWRDLVANLVPTSAEDDILRLDSVAYIDNPIADTQCWTFWNPKDKTIVVAFRGTEQTRLTDVLTDLQLIPAELDPEGGVKLDEDDNAVANIAKGFESVVQGIAKDGFKADLKGILAKGAKEAKKRKSADEKIWAHSGFLKAYTAVRSDVMQLLDAMMDDKSSSPKDWTIYVTGHSLGGALSTLCSYELAIRQKWNNNRPRIVNYSFGSPRVGNRAFANSFNVAVPNCWRVVNNNDAVPLVPRLMGFAHVGHLMKLSPEGTVLKELFSMQSAGEGADVGDIAAAMLLGSEASDDLAEKPEAVAKVIQAEIEAMSNLMNGTAVEEHLEPLYMANMSSAIAEFMKEQEKRK